jgi:hypothetical protein
MAKGAKDFCNWPGEIPKQDILGTLGESKDFRNPFRLPEMGDGWPRTDRTKDYRKILGHESGPGHEIELAPSRRNPI